MWVLGSEPRSSAKATSAVNHWPISPKTRFLQLPKVRKTRHTEDVQERNKWVDTILRIPDTAFTWNLEKQSHGHWLCTGIVLSQDLVYYLELAVSLLCFLALGKKSRAETGKEDWVVALLEKRLPHKHDDLGPICRTHEKRDRCGEETSAGKTRLASVKASAIACPIEKPCLKKQGGWLRNNIRPLHMHIHEHTYIQLHESAYTQNDCVMF